VRGLEGIHGAGAVRIRSEVAMEISRSGEVDAHQRRAYREE
jgi:hypothetical protein